MWTAKEIRTALHKPDLNGQNCHLFHFLHLRMTGHSAVSLRGSADETNDTTGDR